MEAGVLPTKKGLCAWETHRPNLVSLLHELDQVGPGAWEISSSGG